MRAPPYPPMQPAMSYTRCETASRAERCEVQNGIRCPENYDPTPGKRLHNTQNTCTERMQCKRLRPECPSTIVLDRWVRPRHARPRGTFPWVTSLNTFAFPGRLNSGGGTTQFSSGYPCRRTPTNGTNDHLCPNRILSATNRTQHSGGSRSSCKQMEDCSPNRESLYLLQKRDGVDLHARHVEPPPVRLESDASEVGAFVVLVDHRFLLPTTTISAHVHEDRTKWALTSCRYIAASDIRA